MPPLPILFLSAVFLIGGLRCGVSFHDKFEATELFKSMSVCDQSGSLCTKGTPGQFPAGSHLKIDLAVTQGYPVPIEVACYYENSEPLTDDQEKLAFEERATPAARIVLPAASGRQPNDKQQPEQHLSLEFSIPKPGDYFLACVTPAAPENGLGVELKIR